MLRITYRHFIYFSAIPVTNSRPNKQRQFKLISPKQKKQRFFNVPLNALKITGRRALSELKNRGPDETARASYRVAASSGHSRSHNGDATLAIAEQPKSRSLQLS